MPLGDGTGPMGMGPMTGRAAGYCAGFGVPGYMNPIPGGFGYGRVARVGPMVPAAWGPYAGMAGTGAYGYPAAWRPFGFGFGRGWGRGFGRGFGRGWGRGRGGRFGWW